MTYKVVLTEDAVQDLDQYIQYLLVVKQSAQAAKNLLDDFEKTKKSLESVAGSLKLCDNIFLSEQGYRRINFMSHRYFMLYRIEEGSAIVDHIFHEIQDYENKLI